MNDKQAAAIREAVDQNFEAQVAFTAALVRFASLRGQEHTAQDFMAKAFAERQLGVDRWRIDIDDIKHLRGFSPVTISYDNAINVVGVHRSDAPTGRTTWYPKDPMKCGARHRTKRDAKAIGCMGAGPAT